MEGVRVQRTQFLSGQPPLGVGELRSPIPPSSFSNISPHRVRVVNVHLTSLHRDRSN
jgi:hypothetical protein